MPPILGAWDTTTQRDNNNNTTAYEAGLVAQRSGLIRGKWQRTVKPVGLSDHIWSVGPECPQLRNVPGSENVMHVQAQSRVGSGSELALGVEPAFTPPTHCAPTLNPCGVSVERSLVSPHLRQFEFRQPSTPATDCSCYRSPYADTD